MPVDVQGRIHGVALGTYIPERDVISSVTQYKSLTQTLATVHQ